MALFARRILPVASLLGAVLALHPLWLDWLGQYLVRAEGPARADIAVVLGGDASGRRVLTGADLVKQGYVSRVLVSGPAGNYGFYESELAIAFAVKRGRPREWFISFPLEAYSTQDEAAAIVPELRRRGVRSYLLVTSDYHTRRAGNVFRKAAPDLSMRVVAAPDQFFRPRDWWHTRQGRKQAFYEWAKTLAGWVGL